MHELEKWLLPPRCVLTGELADITDLSSPIIQSLKRPSQVCPQCCEPSLQGDLCGACLTQPPAFSRTQVGFYFAEPLDKLIYDFKYHQKPSYARLFAELLVSRLQLDNVEALVAIPTHPLRRRVRGYNQAELLAEALGKILQLPVIKQAVIRIKNTSSQTALTSRQRQENLKNAFQINPERLIGLSHIALVDDVITTGATMQQMAELIHKKTDIKTCQAWSVAKTKR
ncbi:MAG: ComF family protein [Thiomicrorhabdus sp.]|nr:ComF family protein [Thiomicrorhabdus sp.]